MFLTIFLCKIEDCDGLVRQSPTKVGGSAQKLFCPKCGTIYDMWDRSILYKKSENGKMLRNTAQDLKQPEVISEF